MKKYIILFNIFLSFNLVAQNNLTKKQIIEKIRIQYNGFNTYESNGVEIVSLKNNGVEFNEMKSDFKIFANPKKILLLADEQHSKTLLDPNSNLITIFADKSGKQINKRGDSHLNKVFTDYSSFEKSIIIPIARYDPIITLLFKVPHRDNHLSRDSAIDSLQLSDTTYQKEPCYKFQIQYKEGGKVHDDIKLTEKEKKMFKQARDLAKSKNKYIEEFEEKQALIDKKARIQDKRTFVVSYYFRKKDFMLIYYIASFTNYTDYTGATRTITLNPQLNQPLDEKVFEEYSK